MTEQNGKRERYRQTGSSKKECILQKTDRKKENKSKDTERLIQKERCRHT